MKRIHILCCAALLLMTLLAGCRQDTPDPGTVPTIPDVTTAPTEPAPLPTAPVEADTIYFSNANESYRLYSIRRDGTGLSLVLDEQCHDVTRREDTLYFHDGTHLNAYHIPTGNRSVVIENIVDYAVEGDYLIYQLLTNEIGGADLRCRNLHTGTDISIYSDGWSRFWVGFGNLYYIQYDYDYSKETLCAFDPETETSTVIADQFYFYRSVVPVEGGVCFEASADYEEGWYFSAADGSDPVPQTDFLPDNTDLIWHSDEGRLYLTQNDTDPITASLHHVSPAGTDRIIAEQGQSESLYFTSVAPDCWLVESIESVGWGEKNEYGYYETYASQSEYLLLGSDGSLMPLDTAGTAGSMFAAGDFPLLDSSTARIPVTNALYELFVKNYGYEGPEPLCSTTHGAWLNIADRKVDLALLAAPTPEEQAYLDQQGVSVEMKLYGGDGLVFIGNAENPVTDLTHEQIIAIYRGEITNWSQVGGPYHPIIVYYRDEQSGSQRLFKSLVFKGLEIPDFEAMSQEDRNMYLMDEMSTIVDVILAEPYAIGYSIMTYLDEVYAEENLRVFSVNGTLPAPETVQDASYRYHTQGYLVIRSDEPADSPARRLFDWFGCPMSDDLLTACSVSPLHDSKTE